MWDLILAGRWMMLPIGLASLLGLAVIIERIYVLRQSKIVVPEIAEAVETLSASRDLSVAYAICERRPGPFASVSVPQRRNSTACQPTETFASPPRSFAAQSTAALRLGNFSTS